MFPTAAAAMFIFLATVWEKSTWVNTILKLSFFALAAWGGIEALLAWGFIIAPQFN